MNKKLEYKLDTFRRSNQDTCLTHKPIVSEGDWVQSGDLLSDCESSVGGELALGQNIMIAYMPWEGYNFEDAILISERLVSDDLFTSVHIERYEIEINKDSNYTLEKRGALGNTTEITREIPDAKKHDLRNLDSFGIIKPGSWVEEGDILVGKVAPINKKEISPYEKLLYTILEKQIRTYRDCSLRAPKGIKAKVIDIKYFFKKILSFKENKSKELKVEKTKKKQLLSTSPREKVTKKTNNIEKRKKQKKHLSNTSSNQVPYSYLGRNGNLFDSKQNGLNSPLRLFKKVKKQKKELKRLNKIFLNNEIENNSVKTQRSKVSLVSMKALNFNGFNSGKNDKKNLLTQLKVYNQKKRISLRDIEVIHIYLAEKRRIQIGDKMAGRHGNKGIVSQILPREDMPYLPNGTPIDMVLNPLGVPSRMNVGQIYECLLGLAGKHLGENYKVYSFDEIYGSAASRSFVFNKLYEARQKTGENWLFNPNYPGKMRLYDGRTGDGYHQPVTVGLAYILRLVHMVDDKIHMRSTGPYSLVTQQPLRGRSKQGGQRLGEMEVWAIEGYGAAFTLLEMLTIKSDDLTGRMTLWSNLILNRDLTIGTPEAFKVLVCELQALCLDIGLYRYSTSSNKGKEKSTTTVMPSAATSKEKLLLNVSPKTNNVNRSTVTLTEIKNLMSFP